MKKTKEQSGFLFKRRGSPFYYARWWIKGQEHVKSTEKDRPGLSRRRIGWLP
jgi:hypothetical protein